MTLLAIPSLSLPKTSKSGRAIGVRIPWSIYPSSALFLEALVGFGDEVIFPDPDGPTLRDWRIDLRTLSWALEPLLFSIKYSLE